MDSEFISSFNEGNTAFQAACGEEFQILTMGRLGACTAVTIDDLNSSTNIIQGGLQRANSVVLYLKRSVFEDADLREDSKLLVRGERVRIVSILDDGDDTLILTTEPTTGTFR